MSITTSVSQAIQEYALSLCDNSHWVCVSHALRIYCTINAKRNNGYTL